MNFSYITKRFGRLTVSSMEKEGRRTYCFCTCYCGNKTRVRLDSLVAGTSKSCGCLMIENLKYYAPLANYKHGLSGTKGYENNKKAKREQSIIERTPKWLTDEDLLKIREIYTSCPDGMVVDHIIPLKGKLVSGLHVPENLQHLPKHDNLVKSNKFEPIWT